MEEVLKLAGMSKATFARQFPRFTGCTFTEFLCRIRLERARQRIFTGDDAVGTAAYAVGFNHLSHFNRCYRRLYGKSPSDDRRGKGRNSGEISLELPSKAVLSRRIRDGA